MARTVTHVLSRHLGHDHWDEGAFPSPDWSATPLAGRVQQSCGEDQGGKGPDGQWTKHQGRDESLLALLQVAVRGDSLPAQIDQQELPHDRRFGVAR